MNEDIFRVEDIIRVQDKILACLNGGPDDIAVHIAALRSAADLLQQALTMTVLAAQYRSLVGSRN